MSETLEKRTSLENSDYRAEINAYFTPSMRSDEREWYDEHGYVYTNNLHLWFVDSPDQWLREGEIRNPFDYRQREFGSVMEEFRDSYRNLWNGVKEASDERKRDMEGFKDPDEIRKLSRDELAALIEKDREFSRHFEVVKNQAFDVLAPMLMEAGINPLDVCV